MRPPVPFHHDELGVQTFEQTKLNANQIDAWKVLQTRRMGEPFNAETALAARHPMATVAPVGIYVRPLIVSADRCSRCAQR